ncbi:MAG: PspC domain-containing protein [Bifidobacteriaceae bacterium]|jgi:signal transduction histidine kinase/phage shock protein PspC (stress-responsive transcriptional regulator)|nr:PspC domain-containing protein [Bifidobacteriaceae bacterium]
MPADARAAASAELRRPREGRMVAGVAAGLARHLGISVTAARWGLAIAGLTGTGAVLYLWLWLTVPSADTAAPPPLVRLAPMLRDKNLRSPLLAAAGGLMLLALAAMVAATAAGAAVPWQWLIPLAALLGGLILAWSQLDRIDAGARRGPISWLRLIGAVALMVLGTALLISQGRGPSSLVAALLAGLAVLAAVALVGAPWWLRLINALGDQRAATAREAERADIAAHLHDSVLQTLALIRAQAADEASVRRLARAQERELRQWLYQDRVAPAVSLAAALKETAAEVEDAAGAEIGVVVVGDHPPMEAAAALIGATREGLLNAVRHGAPPVSLYAEIGPALAEVFIKDRGPGFDLAQVPGDRLGVRESIIGRIRRQGGQAEVVSKTGGGTEVRLRLALGVKERA